MDSKLKHLYLFEEFVEIEIKDSTVNINIDSENADNGPKTDLASAQPGDEVLFDMPPISLSPVEDQEGEPAKEKDDIKESSDVDDDPEAGEGDEGDENPDLDKEIEGD